jgi:hypothetical protein
MRIRTMAGIAIATAATAGGIALGTAAFAADDPGSAQIMRIDQGTSSQDTSATYTPEDCPERGGGGPSSGGSGPSSGGAESGAADETL